MEQRESKNGIIEFINYCLSYDNSDVEYAQDHKKEEIESVGFVNKLWSNRSIKHYYYIYSTEKALEKFTLFENQDECVGFVYDPGIEGYVVINGRNMYFVDSSLSFCIIDNQEGRRLIKIPYNEYEEHEEYMDILFEGCTRTDEKIEFNENTIKEIMAFCLLMEKKGY